MQSRGRAGYRTVPSSLELGRSVEDGETLDLPEGALDGRAGTFAQALATGSTSADPRADTGGACGAAAAAAVRGRTGSKAIRRWKARRSCSSAAWCFGFQFGRFRPQRSSYSARPFRRPMLLGLFSAGRRCGSPPGPGAARATEPPSSRT